MKADFTISNAINAGYIKELNPAFYNALEASWSKQTASPSMQRRWSANNPAAGQDLVTVLALWAERGYQDTLIIGLINGKQPHLSLDINIKGVEVSVDPTWQQFADTKSKGRCFYEEIGPDNKKALYFKTLKSAFYEDLTLDYRLNQFLKSMRENGADLNVSAEQILEQLRTRYIGYAPQYKAVPAGKGLPAFN